MRIIYMSRHGVALRRLRHCAAAIAMLPYITLRVVLIAADTPLATPLPLFQL